MSTELKSIKGFTEQKIPGKMEVKRVPTELFLTRFWGGNEKGTMLQITPYTGGYIQLTKDQVKELVDELTQAFDL